MYLNLLNLYQGDKCHFYEFQDVNTVCIDISRCIVRYSHFLDEFCHCHNVVIIT